MAISLNVNILGLTYPNLLFLDSMVCHLIRTTQWAQYRYTKIHSITIQLFDPNKNEINTISL